MDTDTGIVEQIKGLLQSSKADEFDKLKKMLEFVKEINEQSKQESGSPDFFMAAQKMGKENERRTIELEHAERMKALELGRPFSDSGEIARARSVIRAAATLGILVSLALTGALIGLSILIIDLKSDSRIQFFGLDSDLRGTLFGIAWGVAGLLLLFTIGYSLHTINRARPASPSRERAPLPRQGFEDRPPE